MKYLILENNVKTYEGMIIKNAIDTIIRIKKMPKGKYYNISTKLLNLFDLNMTNKGIKGTLIKLKGTGPDTSDENHRSSFPNFYIYFAIECK